MRLYKVIFLSIILLIFGGNVLATESVYDLNLDVKEFQLENGMLFLVVERPATPQVAVRLAIRAGSALEESGKTGIAHLLEHMMFKGTRTIGTKDIDRDLAIMEELDALREQMRDEEEEHGDNAIEAGAAELPAPVKRLMQLTAKVMTKTAYWV